MFINNPDFAYLPCLNLPVFHPTVCLFILTYLLPDWLVITCCL